MDGRRVPGIPAASDPNPRFALSWITTADHLGPTRIYGFRFSHGQFWTDWCACREIKPIPARPLGLLPICVGSASSHHQLQPDNRRVQRCRHQAAASVHRPPPSFGAFHPAVHKSGHRLPSRTRPLRLVRCTRPPCWKITVSVKYYLISTLGLHVRLNMWETFDPRLMFLIYILRSLEMHSAPENSRQRRN
jgi:hypothetical protein